ncbi:MAG: CotH kinase family protein [Anaerolineales bacterium]|nr:CotH kinase family protein [Anaerolineales bacterium]
MSLTLKRNLPLLLLLAAMMAALVLVIGNQRVIAYTTSNSISTRLSTAGGNDVSNTVALFDDGLVHEIQVLMSDSDYDSMITTYQQTGEKEYFQADVIIDGVRINDVGIRLRGNASLRTALGGGGGAGFGLFGGGQPDGVQFPEGQLPPFGEGGAPEGMLFGQGQAMPEDMQGFQPPAGRGGQGGQPPEGFAPPEGAEQGPGGMQPGGFQFGGGGMGREPISEELIKIPFMIKFDEYVDGQTYQGYSAIAIRNYGTSYDEAMLQEPISNYAANLAGLPATETVFTGFSLNDEAERLYVVSALVDESYLAKHFSGTLGVLYKADVGASLSYAGEEPSSYANSFSQETRVNDADMKPLIDFTRFLDEADDATFEAELPERLDVDGFANYLAINAMLVNTDSMLGMNNNYYLYYDEQAGKMTVLLWDTNESLSKLGGNVSYNLDLNNLQQGGFGGGGGMGRGGGIGGGSNTLLTRFIANDTFRALYQQKLQAVYDAVFANDALVEKADEYAALVLAANERGLVDEQTYTAAVESIKTFLQQRKEYIQSTGLVLTGE